MKYTIALVTGGLLFSGDSLEKGSLGGSETAFLQMAKALAAQGHRVLAFCNCPRPGVYDGVEYASVDHFQKQANTMTFDIVIASRWMEFLRGPGASGLRVLWCHDTLVDANRFMGSLYKTDLVMVLSKYHSDNYKAQIPEFEKFSWITKNGIDLKLVQDNIKPKVKGKVIYTSRPERGLHFLLSDILPKLIEKRPDIVLHFANYDLKGLQVPPQIEMQIQSSLELAKRFPKNVKNMGHLTKDKLYQEMSSAELLLYPSDFPEISCITAIEAQACGTPIVCTKDFALPETVGPEAGVLIEGHPSGEKYIEEFVSFAYTLLGDPDIYKAHQNAGLKWIEEAGYTWDKIAESWMEKFESILKVRWQERESSVLTQLVRNGDLRVAELIDPDFGTDDFKISELKEEAKKFKVPTAAEVHAEFQKALPRFEFAARFHNLEQKPPKTILDYGTGYASFGLVASKYWPDAKVVLADREELVYKQALGNIKKMELENVAALHLLSANGLSSIAPSVTFDLIFLGDMLELQEDPQSFLKSFEPYLSEDGVFVITSSVGPTACLAKDTLGKRLWSLGYSECLQIFKGSKHFDAAYQDEELNELGEPQGHWCVIASPPESYGKIDLEKKKLLTRPYEKLSVCVIASEEEQNIEQMLVSVHPIADEIRVVDNRPEGSTDRTPEICAKYGAIVTTAVFDNFSQVRNESIKDAKGDWILWIDSDERLLGIDNFRKYVSNGIYEGYSIKQVHLTIDEMNRSYDIPVRLLRNRPHYQFVGLIHEHCEDLSKGKFDNPIAPRLLLPDVDIAHFGYLNERIRRYKCSSRNMALLQRSVKEQPERQLTWVLVIRDYLNILKWNVTKDEIVERGSKTHQLLEAVVDTFKKHFPSQDTPYFSLAWPMYQEALMVLGKMGLPYKDCSKPPFELLLSLMGGMGGIQEPNIRPERVWFLDYEEMEYLIKKRTTQLAVGLGIVDPKEHKEILEATHMPRAYGAGSDAEALLSSGINVIKR